MVRPRVAQSVYRLGYGLGSLGFILYRGKKLFSYPKRPDWPRSPASLQVNGCRWLFPRGVKWPWSEVDHSPSSAEVENEWSYSPVVICIYIYIYISARRGMDFIIIIIIIIIIVMLCLCNCVVSVYLCICAGLYLAPRSSSCTLINWIELRKERIDLTRK